MPVITAEQTEQNEDLDPYMIPSEDESLSTSDDFILNESSGPKTGLWVGQVIFAPKGVETALQIRLAERPSGVIEIDTGSREPGARFSTGLRDWQGAVTLAEEHLREMIQIRLRGISVEEELVEAGGDLSIEQAKRAVLQLKKNSVSPEYLSQLERIFDIVIALVGPTKSALELEENFVQRYIEKRTTSTIRFPSHLERPVGSLTPASKATAAKEIHRFAAQIRMLSKTRRAPGETARALQFCPFDDHLVRKKMPNQKALMGPGKDPLRVGHLLQLLSEEETHGGEILPAAVDAADPSGQLRLTVSILFDQARRRESVTMLLRRNIAVTPEEVRAMLERINGPVRPEWAHYFMNGLIEWEGELDKEGYHRVYPISDFLKAELDLYEERVGWSAFGLNDWLFKSPTDPAQPIPWKTLYNTPERRKAKKGESYLNASGREGTAQGGEICYLPSGEEKLLRKGGRYHRAVRLLRRRQREQGVDERDLFPVVPGQVVHGFRTGWAKRMHELGYGREVVVDERLKVDLDQNADYLGDWAAGGTVKHERYVSLHPIVLMGIVECRVAKEVIEELARARAEQIKSGMQDLAKLRRLHGRSPHEHAA